MDGLMKKYTIEKNVRIPKRGDGYHYPWKNMEVGDSFTVPIEERPKATNSANLYRMHNDKWLYKSRKEGDLVRYWRIQ